MMATETENIAKTLKKITLKCRYFIFLFANYLLMDEF